MGFHVSFREGIERGKAVMSFGTLRATSGIVVSSRPPLPASVPVKLNEQIPKGPRTQVIGL